MSKTRVIFNTKNNRGEVESFEAFIPSDGVEIDWIDHEAHPNKPDNLCMFTVQIRFDTSTPPKKIKYEYLH